MKNYCEGCKYESNCKIAYSVNFCRNCRDYYDCEIRTEFCEDMHYIECNNGFIPKSEYDEDEWGY